MKRALPWLLLPLICGLMLAAAYAPIPVPHTLDFRVIYFANKGLMFGAQLYDQAAQEQVIANLAGVSSEQVTLHPFPYPPWYALITLPLAHLPIMAAARLWLELNLVMLLLSVWFLTDEWESRKRLVAFIAAIVFLPVLGALYVGQYVFPVLLGLALLTFALHHKRPALIALAAALLTFKPHLGGLVLLALIIYLWGHRSTFGKRALWMTIALGVFLFGIGFLADSAWPVRYLHSITGYGKIPGVQTCEICASLPITVAKWLNLPGMQPASLIAGLLLLLLLGLIFWKRSMWMLPGPMVAGVTLVTLLVSPYLLNYDFVLLIVPVFILAGQAKKQLDWFLIGVAYILPWLGLGLFGRQGNIVLILSTFLIAVRLYQRATERSLVPK
jgi:hypothetical protein